MMRGSRELLVLNLSLPMLSPVADSPAFGRLITSTFSDDSTLMACGFSESYIRLWSLKQGGNGLRGLRMDFDSDSVGDGESSLSFSHSCVGWGWWEGGGAGRRSEERGGRRATRQRFGFLSQLAGGSRALSRLPTSFCLQLSDPAVEEQRVGEGKGAPND